MIRFYVDGSNALITGASAGIGREFARQLGARANTLILVARRKERLESLRDELTQGNPNVRVHVHVTDLSDEQAVRDLYDWLEHENLEIDLLINNAGLGDIGPFSSGEAEKLKQMLSVNIAALTLLTRLLLPSMIKRGRGAILNVSSTAGFLPIAGFAVYAATKAYVNSFSEAIRAELRSTGITVTTLCPGPVPTEFTEVARRRLSGKERSSPAFVQVSAEETVRTALDGLAKAKAVVVPGLIMKLGMLFVRLTPMPLLRLVSRLST